MDAHVDGMVYASVEHPPVLGGKVKSYDEKAPLQVKGVKQTIPIKPFTPPHHFQPLGGVAVIADNTWAAFQGRKKLNVAWDNGANASYNSDQYKKELQETARKPGKVARNIGDVDAAFAKGGKIMEADYYAPHLAHAPMEPPVALADYRDGKVTVWTSHAESAGGAGDHRRRTRHPQRKRDLPRNSAGWRLWTQIETGLRGRGSDSVEGHGQAGEGSVEPGRRHQVRLLSRRRRDVHEGRAGRKRKANGLAAALGVSAHRFHLRLEHDLRRRRRTGQGWTDLPFDLPNHRVENGSAENHVRIGWFRSVANIYHAFAAQSFANELAHASGRDSVEYLLELIGPARIVDVKATAPDYDNYGGSPTEYPLDTARMRRVVELAAEKSGWGKRKLGKGSGMGIAVHRSFLTYVATVVEVEVDDQGEVKIPVGTHRRGRRHRGKSGSYAGAVRGCGGFRNQHRAEWRDHGEGRSHRAVEFQ